VDNGIFLDVLDLIDMSVLGINNDKQGSEARGQQGPIKGKHRSQCFNLEKRAMGKGGDGQMKLCGSNLHQDAFGPSQ
jgi:hypothetical protein